MSLSGRCWNVTKAYIPLEKRKSLSLTDQDSAEKQIRIMAIQMWRSRNDPTDSSEEDENIYTGAKKEQTVSSPFLPSYIKSYSETQIKSTIVDHTWKVDQLPKFMCLPNMSMIKSPPFPDRDVV
ncbi:uncharacterized protein LOC112468001 [Temnothorax curvispinosus]|uniref:Uncharacterized protein LOC112468001 n=1 Tax=Temnothorax curvispinosus TaxID=300111 RepID=A0A6J1RJ04_9HYME|nr:uncharacterized protein LOC112468001 [Temnothorax curvispinosus]